MSLSVCVESLTNHKDNRPYGATPQTGQGIVTSPVLGFLPDLETVHKNIKGL